MKKKTEVLDMFDQNAEDPHSKEAQKILDLAKEYAGEYNAREAKKALAKFNRTKRASLFRFRFEMSLGGLVGKFKAASRGEFSYPYLGVFHDFEKILSADTTIEYMGLYVNDIQRDAKIVSLKDDIRQLCFEGRVVDGTWATKRRENLCDAVIEYARRAAIYAKHIGSESVRQWAEIICICQRIREDACGSSIADRLIELEREAIDRLGVDKVIYELPAYKKGRKVR